ncbi:hypothetical protein Q7P37_000484 [Cladosporium fusiforme]
MDNGVEDTPATGASDHHIGRLACQACQRKKIKCDRTYPCGQCTRSNLHCNPSTRKQRARHAGKRGVDAELKNRISKLESLVESLSGDTAPTSTGSDSNTTESPPPLQDTSGSAAVPSMRKYVASSFWSSLTSEVQALRDTLEEDEPEGEDSPESAPQELPQAASELNIEYDLIVCPPGRIYVMPGGFVEPTPQVAKQILDAYLSNVEPIFRLFHTPTLVSFMRDGSSYLGQPWDAPGNQALKRAIWMAGVNSLSSQDCFDITGETRTDALNHYKRLVGISLAQADLVNTNDMATLQAFTVYLTACRTDDTTRRMWTLISVLMRIATAMNLHRGVSTNCKYYSPFQIELRRRLWWRIRYLDVFSSIDRGSELLINAESYSVPLPTLTNDELFDESSQTIPVLEGCDTDTSFVNMCFDACEVIDSLLKPEVHPSGDTWEKRHKLALEFSSRVDERYMQYFNAGTPFDGFRRAVGESMKASMILRAVRPMQRYVSSTPPRVDSPYVLRMAKENLRGSEEIYKLEGAERWRWQIWVQWHALAVALAGLCSIRGTPLADEAWYHVERQYERSAKYVADSRNGMLWRPVEKLYKKATAFRDGAAKQTQNTLPPQPQQSIDFNNAFSQADFNASIPTTSMDGFQSLPADFAQSFPTESASMSAPNTLSMDQMTLNPSMGTTQMSPGFGNFDPFAVDPSWVDWEQIMSDYADTGDMMTDVQAWQYETHAGKDGSFL